MAEAAVVMAVEATTTAANSSRVATAEEAKIMKVAGTTRKAATSMVASSSRAAGMAVEGGIITTLNRVAAMAMVVNNKAEGMITGASKVVEEAAMGVSREVTTTDVNKVVEAVM